MPFVPVRAQVLRALVKNNPGAAFRVDASISRRDDVKDARADLRFIHSDTAGKWKHQKQYQSVHKGTPRPGSAVSARVAFGSRGPSRQRLEGETKYASVGPLGQQILGVNKNTSGARLVIRTPFVPHAFR